MRSSLLLAVSVVFLGNLALAESWYLEPEPDIRLASSLVPAWETQSVVVEDSFAGEDPWSTSPVLEVQGAWISHRGGLLAEAYDDGVGAQIGLNSLITRFGFGSDLYWTTGIDYQQWDPKGYNATTPINNYRTDGQGESLGAFFGFGLEETSATSWGDEAFVFLQATVGVGQTTQDFVLAPLDPTLKTIAIDANRPESKASYVNGQFSAGVGINHNYASLAFVTTYQVMRTGLITDSRHTSHGLFLGIQGTFVLDELFCCGRRH